MQNDCEIITKKADVPGSNSVEHTLRLARGFFMPYHRLLLVLISF